MNRPRIVTWPDGVKVVRDKTDDELTEAEAQQIEREAMVCSRFQAKAALTAAGLLSGVEAAVAAGDATVQLAWAEAVELKRLSPMIVALAAALELTDDQVDDLFRAAMLIEV